jgi:putative transposase
MAARPEMVPALLPQAVEATLQRGTLSFKECRQAIQELLDKAEITQSMSRAGKCLDNGSMESFWETLKCERYYLRSYATFKKLEKDMRAYISF